MWFQAAECNKCELIIKFNKQQLSDFFNRESSHFESLLTSKSENLRPHYSHSSCENAIPSSGRSPLASCNGVIPPPPGVFRTRSWWRSVVKVARSGVCVTLSEISLSFFSGIQFFWQFVSYFRNNVRRLLSWNFLWDLHDIDDNI